MQTPTTCHALPPLLMTIRHKRNDSPILRRRKLKVGDLTPGLPLKRFFFPLHPPASLVSFLHLAWGFVVVVLVLF